MTTANTDPILVDWSIDATGNEATAAEVSTVLADYSVSDLDTELVPFLAAAAAELASLAAIPWRFSPDDPAVALLRLIAKATLANPDASGPHTTRLLHQLTASTPPPPIA